MGAMANSLTASYVGWEEVVVSSEKGQRVVHYYLKRSGGDGADLVVVGKEKSVRHMSYHYVKDINNLLMLSNVNRCSFLKLRSRREVIDWMNSIISGSDEHPNCSPRQFGGDTENTLDADIIQDVGTGRTEFMWLGSPWTCKKRRRHYPSFCRYGVTISVHSFVYVLAEENKRLVAYLDDIYEDSHGNKMAVVRWFHKIDEVGFVLPHNFNDREIFFSLCLQDLSIECIDGLATVLSPEHYERFTTEAIHTGLVLFVCCRLFENEEFKPFDITRVKGYWKQALLKSTSSIAYEPSDAKPNLEGSFGDAVGCRPNKRIRWSTECEKFLKPAGENVSIEANLKASVGRSSGLKTGFRMIEGCSSPPLFWRGDTFQNLMHYLTVGSRVEILCQDSGIRGCWFRALIIKKNKDKVKVRYEDIKDAADDEKNLEEWVLASRKATPDVLGVRLPGRTIIRPSPRPGNSRVPSVLNVGSVVDAWWHDGWWEGIVVNKESEDRVQVFLLGEKQEQVFSPGNLRHSQEWLNSGWQSIEERPEILSKLCGVGIRSDVNQLIGVSPSATQSGDRDLVPMHDESQQKGVRFGETGDDDKVQKKAKFAKDLSKDGLLAQLRWQSTRKRRFCRSPVHKLHDGANSNEFSGNTCEKTFVGSTVKFHRDNWKYGSEFCSSAVSHLTSLIVSR